MDNQVSNLRGVTLVEMLIVISLLISLASLGLFVSFSHYQGVHFRDERMLVIGTLQKARSQALAHLCFAPACTAGVSHGVYFGTPGEYVVYEGDSYATRHETEDERIESQQSGPQLLGCRDMQFRVGSGNGSCLDGEPQVLVQEQDRVSTITVSPVGRIWWDD